MRQDATRPAIKITVMVASGLLCLCACTREAPKGEVLARVDGKEITLRDVEAERRTQQANPPSDLIVRQLVQRTVLANAAHARGLDQGPNFPADMRRLRSELLASRELAVLGRVHATPKEAEAKVDAVDRQLSSRSFYILRQLRVSPAELLASVAHAASPAAAEAELGDQKLWIEAVQALESTNLAPMVRQKLDAALAGHTPIAVQEGDEGLLTWVESRQAATLSTAARARLAQQIAARTAAGEAQAAGVHQLQSAAKVVYQPGVGGRPRTTSPAARYKMGDPVG